ncbi:hypothetical protein K7432_011983 [Basidiobolus ranarum]|uniref:Glycoside hydrolase/deacetylase n=1 Tax=Basidiobolus ranarum TaxID=34480 RepID=A0ABR2VTT7_9FUNG
MHFSKASLILLAIFFQANGSQARVSTDNTCGVIKGQTVTCPSGQCCSTYGWCGVTIDHCETNCSSQCKKVTTKLVTTAASTTSKSTATSKPTTSNSPTKSPVSTSSATVPNGPIQTVTSTDWSCGTKGNIFTQCPPGYCCSEFGYCGNTAEFCKNTTPVQQPLGKVAPGQVVTTCAKTGTFAVTFDDGPSQYTGTLLDTLKAKNVKVTFFVIGSTLEQTQNRNFLKRAYDEGHHIASHTYTHISLSNSTEAVIRSEMTKTSDAIFKVIGKRPQFMRPPYGEYNAMALGVMKDMGYKVIIWNVDTLDWQTQNSQSTLKVYTNTLASANSKTGTFISLQHDIQPTTVQVASQILDSVLKAGFKITTVPDCLGDTGLYF